MKIPLQRLVCVTGVSGSGKTTLVRELLLPALAARLKADASLSKASERMDSEANGDDLDDAGNATAMSLSGAEHLNRVVLVDQSILGKTPRSNPAVYIGAFDELREFFAQSDIARQRGLNASAFSFNSSQGQCERCRGAGFEKIEMQFLSDVFIRCPDCDGRRYRSHIVDVKIGPVVQGGESSKASTGAMARSIADLLDSTVEEVIAFLAGFPESRPARRALASLKLLEEVGLGYLKIGQPINTLSGGESQRLKLVRHLAEALQPVVKRDSYPETSKSEKVLVLREAMNKTIARFRNGASSSEVDSFEPEGQPENGSNTLFLFDEPTTGLHFDDVRVLLKVFQRLVDAGHSVVVIEHNLEVLKSADWLIDLGPGAGDEGGRLVAEGTPEEVAGCAGSYTGQALREVLPSQTAVRGRSNATLPTSNAQPTPPCRGI